MGCTMEHTFCGPEDTAWLSPDGLREQAMYEAAEQLVDTLKPEQAQAIRLHCRDGMTFQAAARAVGIQAHSTMQYRCEAGLRKLQEAGAVAALRKAAECVPDSIPHGTGSWWPLVEYCAGGPLAPPRPRGTRSERMAQYPTPAAAFRACLANMTATEREETKAARKRANRKCAAEERAILRACPVIQRATRHPDEDGDSDAFGPPSPRTYTAELPSFPEIPRASNINKIGFGESPLPRETAERVLGNMTQHYRAAVLASRANKDVWLAKAPEDFGPSWDKWLADARWLAMDGLSEETHIELWGRDWLRLNDSQSRRGPGDRDRNGGGFEHDGYTWY